MKIKIIPARKKVRTVAFQTVRTCPLATRSAGGLLVERTDKIQCL